MPEAQNPVGSLGDFVARVGEFRQHWGLANHKELWFRGESRDHGDTILRPELYRPPSLGASLKPIRKLLTIENDLHEEFKRVAVERCSEPISEDDWDWDSYFLMQHHSGPTRLLDWSDGALMALHFALRNKKDNEDNALVYVLEPYRLSEYLKSLPDIKLFEEAWKPYVAKHPSDDLNDDEWEDGYLPADEDANTELPVPRPPLVLDFPLITRRIAAQRSRFIVFGTDPAWLSEEFRKADSTIKVIEIAAEKRAAIRQELRDCGVTESVIYPDLDGLGREMRQLWDDRRAAAEENS
ncbi:MAG TPA: FRG domain-containing protein [Bryobacteraceae bacterium]|nr:FRG domain-containing protein [Bryobacteraceae bacterium]